MKLTLGTRPHVSACSAGSGSLVMRTLPGLTYLLCTLAWHPGKVFDDR